MTRPKVHVTFSHHVAGGPWSVTVDGVECEPGGTLADLYLWLSERGLKRDSDHSVVEGHAVVYRVRFRLGDWRDEFYEGWAVPRKVCEPDSSPRDAGCTGKVAHDDQAGALAHATRLLTSPKYVRPEGRLLRAYECRRCGAWHVGHEKWNGRDWTESQR